MDTKYKIAAAVLIGGHSRRMGSPKEDMTIPGDGRTFLDRICDEVDSCFGKCLCGRYLSARKGQKREREGYTVVWDEYDDIGPLGGLISVLKRARIDGCDAVLLLACDMTEYTGTEMASICNMYNNQDILFARTDKTHLQPLASIYGINVLDIAIQQAESGDNRLRMLAGHALSVGYYDSCHPGEYANINTPNDHIRYKSR